MLKLVIADDEKLIREVLSRCTDWASMGVELVAVCKDGLEAFDAIQKYRPQLVLTDIKMPGMSGLELAAYFSKRESYIMEFLFLTGHEEFDFALSAIENGVHHYLVKPVTDARLAEAIQQASNEVNRKLAAAKAREALENTVPYSTCVQQIIDIVEVEYVDPDLSLKKIAEERLFMNEDYLGRRFQKETGKRFNQFLTELRVNKAKYLLRHSTESINDIAEKVGYGNNPKYFGSVFRKMTEQTPLSYRQSKR